MEALVSTSFVVEADRTTAGVAVRVPGGFRFFHSDPRFQPLDGKVFRRARTLASRVRTFARRYARDKQSDGGQAS
jgi:hypothetical protein